MLYFLYSYYYYYFYCCCCWYFTPLGIKIKKQNIIIIILIINGHFENAQLTTIVTQAPVTTRNQVYEVNRKVLSERLKQSRDKDEWCSSDDRVFQALAPDVENARGSNVSVCVLCKRSWLSSPERSRERPETDVVVVVVVVVVVIVVFIIIIIVVVVEV